MPWMIPSSPDEYLRLIEDEPTFIDKDKKKKPASSAVRANVNRQIRDEIDLRGKTGDEAWLAVDKYLDEVILAGLHSVRLIHGKGTGALKDEVRRYLRSLPQVASATDDHPDRGGSGITIVTFKE